MADFCVHCATQLLEEGVFCHKCGKPKTGPGAIVHSGNDPHAVATALAPAEEPEEEKVFYRESEVCVTNTRFIVSGQTYAMSGITSIRFIKVSPNNTGAVVLLLVGLVLLFIPDIRLYGVAGVVAGIAWAWFNKPTYAVGVSSASGERHAIEEKDRNFIQDIVDALNKAIVYRR